MGILLRSSLRLRDDGFVCLVSIKDSITRNPTIPEAHRILSITNGSPTVIGIHQENARHPLRRREGRGCSLLLQISSISAGTTQRNSPWLTTRLKALIESISKSFAVNWIVDSQQSSQQAENPRLRHIFKYLTPAVKVTNAHISKHTARRLAIQHFEKHKTRVKGVLKESPGQIHVAFDGSKHILNS
jgi:hypothetical protein